MSEAENPFWTFSLALYGQPGVADECLGLQDTLGVNVNVLLFSAWIGVTAGIELEPADFRSVLGAVRNWDEAAVRPLREVRRNLKQFESNGAVTALRARVKCDELEAERIEQGLLYAVAGRLVGRRIEPAEALRRNLRAVIAWHTVDRSLQASPAVGDCPLLVSAAMSSA